MKNDESILLTILTPTYNRKKELAKLVESLKRQTRKDFQWLIIDDGSTDGTEEYVKSIVPEEFEIEYHFKKNGGKHTALNYSHQYIKGEYVCIVDSDDYLTPDAVQIICTAIMRYVKNPEIACLSFLRGRTESDPIVKGFPQNPVISDHITFRLNGKRGGDCCEVERTKVLKEFPFPEYPGEKFMSEGYLWVNMGMKYKTVYINRIIYICEYLEGGLTNSGRKMRIKCPLGGMENSNTFLAVKGSKHLNLKLLVKELLLYITYGKFADNNFFMMLKKCNRPFLMTLAYPFGLLMYNDWKKRYK